jgi:hypothetical protein
MLQSKNITMMKGFTIVMWIRPELVQPDASNKRIIDSSTLFYITTSKHISIEVHLKNKSVFYRFKNSNQDERNEENIYHLFDIEYSKWFMLVFSHKPSSFLHKSEFTAYKDTDVYTRLIEYPNLKNQKIMSIGFFKDFTGQVSNVFLSSDFLISQATVNELNHFNFGIYNEKAIRVFRSIIEKDNNNISKNNTELRAIFDSMLFMYSPCRVKTGNICKDLVDNINGELITIGEGNILLSGVAYDYNYQNDIQSLGGANIFLPIFEFFSKNKFIGANVLEEAINLIILIIDNRELNQVRFLLI